MLPIEYSANCPDNQPDYCRFFTFDFQAWTQCICLKFIGLKNEYADLFVL